MSLRHALVLAALGCACVAAPAEDRAMMPAHCPRAPTPRAMAKRTPAMVAGPSLASDSPTVFCARGPGKEGCARLGEPYHGQDGDYRVRVPQWIAEGEAVRDSVTSLVWQRVAPRGHLDFADAETYCTAIRDGGFEDWRLPTRAELGTLFDYGASPVALPAALTIDDPVGAEVYALWSTTRVGEGRYLHTISGQSRVVHMTDPNVNVRCVRGASPGGEIVVQLEGETVLDPKSGLEWQRDRSQPDMSFECALAYCESLVLAGAEDWRLPSIKELASLVDERFTPALDPKAFPGTMPPMLMSSTIVRDSHQLGDFWGISLTPSTLTRSQVVPYVYAGDYPYPFRCVRG